MTVSALPRCVGDRRHAVCVLDAAGAIVAEEAIANTREVLTAFCARFPGATIIMETGTHSPWVSRLVAARGHRVLGAPLLGSEAPNPLSEIKRFETRVSTRLLTAGREVWIKRNPIHATIRLHAECIATSCSLHRTAPCSPLLDQTMKSRSALFFQVAIVLIGIGVLALLLWEPHLEGRNAHATAFEIYFHDPFLTYAYVGSTPFFVALYRAFGLFGHVRQNRAFSQVTVAALRTIRHCAIALIGFVAGGVVFIMLSGDEDDRPAGIVMSLLVILAAGVVATAAAMFARNLQNSLRRSEGSRS